MRAVLAAAAAAAASAQYAWQEAWTTSWVDNYNVGGAGTYQQRYLINNSYWGGPESPIFFYTGNEGDITLFAQNTGFMWDLAPSYGALLVFAEHRYYGQSNPFGSHSYDNATTLQYLSSEQALADYAWLLDFLKANLSASTAPVVSFGGSYGGMLTAWFRMKYPASTVGGIAASAPILQFTDVTPPTAYNGVVTRTWGAANSVAPTAIYNTWGAMTTLSATQSGRETIRSTLGICDALNQPSDVTNTVFNWLSNAIGYMTMADYPYPASFLGPMPAWPVAAAAAYFTNASGSPTELMAAMRAGPASIFYNYSGQAGACFNLSSLNPPGLTGDGWGVQSCGEMVMPIGQYGPPNDMFWIAPWSLQADIAGCQQQFGLTPRPNMVRIEYGVTDLSGASNIVFSNGNLDPWSSGGVLTNVTGNPSIIALVIDQGAHHLDLRAANPADPPSVISVRLVEQAAIRSWLVQHYRRIGSALAARFADD